RQNDDLPGRTERWKGSSPCARRRAGRRWFCHRARVLRAWGNKREAPPQTAALPITPFICEIYWTRLRTNSARGDTADPRPRDPTPQPAALLPPCPTRGRGHRPCVSTRCSKEIPVMFSNPLAIAAIGVACVAAAAGGSYLATRQNAGEVASPTAQAASA